MEQKRYDINDLTSLMSRLRNKNGGCPWDLEQNFETIKPHTIEEAYEVADAIERNDMDDLKDELGDLLFQVIFHSQMAAEQDLFTMDDVIHHVTEKMIFRHPHVFKDVEANTAKEVEQDVWEQQKALEKSKKATNTDNNYYLDDLTKNLPALTLANKIQKRVRRVGFQYPTMHANLDKLMEEIEEFKEAYEENDADATKEEYGDILFVVALLGEEVDANPEESLRMACSKFIRRFNAVENALRSKGIKLQNASIEEMTGAWHQIKDHNEKS